MKQSRLDALADGIFAIVMTILVFEIKIPELGINPNNFDVIRALINIFPLFLSYLLSFAVLFTYWRAHHFIASVYTKSINLSFTNYNAIFFFFVALIPFSSRLLGSYSHSQVSIFIFAINIIAISLSLYEMRSYARDSVNIENEEIDKKEERHAFMRILFPAYCALVAIIISFFSTTFALFLLTVSILYNLLPNSTKYTFRLLGKE